MSPTQATTPTPQLTMPEQLTKSQAFAWEDYRRLARIHVWPAGSDMTWVFISKSRTRCVLAISTEI